MILFQGHHEPTKAQLADARRWADDSFCASAPLSFMENFPATFPNSNEWGFGTETPILLKLKNVEPHDDPWVGSNLDGYDFDNPPVGWDKFGAPMERLAIFWVLSIATHSRHVNPIIHLGCGADVAKLKVGDFVVFDDQVTHWVMSDKTWHGAAIQLARKSILSMLNQS